jgi:hypothetical protein
MLTVPLLRGLRQEDFKFQVSLGNIVSHKKEKSISIVAECTLFITTIYFEA